MPEPLAKMERADVPLLRLGVHALEECPSRSHAGDPAEPDEHVAGGLWHLPHVLHAPIFTEDSDRAGLARVNPDVQHRRIIG